MTTEVTVTTSTAVVNVTAANTSTVTTSGAATAEVSVSPAVVWPAPASFTVAGGTLGTQPTFNGAPLFSGTYLKTGSLVHFTIQVDFDNITSFGTGQYFLDLPFTPADNYQFGSGCLHDASSTARPQYPMFGHVYAGNKQMLLFSMDTQGNTVYNIAFTHNAPITLTTADNFHISGDYITSD